MQNDQTYPEGGLIEFDHGLWRLLSNNHIALQKCEQVHDQLLELKPLLIECVVLGCCCCRRSLDYTTASSWGILGAAGLGCSLDGCLGALEEVRHELLVGDEF